MKEPTLDEARRMLDESSFSHTTWMCHTCGYDLTGTIRADLRRCPECGSEFTIRALLAPVVNQSPRLRTDEVRVRGWLLIAAACLFLALVITLLTLL